MSLDAPWDTVLTYEVIGSFMLVYFSFCVMFLRHAINVLVCKKRLQVEVFAEHICESPTLDV